MSATVQIRRTGGAGMQVNQATAGVRFSRLAADGFPTGLTELATGTGAGQVDQVYFRPFTVPAGGSVAVDLQGGGGELDLANRPLALVKVKWLYLEVTAPASGKRVDLGPQGAANAFPGWWPGVTAADKTPVRDKFEQCDPNDGWAVGGSTKVLTISNPGGAAVSGFLILAGTTA